MYPVPRADLRALTRLRLERDLTFQAFADEIGISYPLLHRLLNTDAPAVFERTLFKVRRYLDQQPKRSRSRRTA